MACSRCHVVSDLLCPFCHKNEALCHVSNRMAVYCTYCHQLMTYEQLEDNNARTTTA